MTSIAGTRNIAVTATHISAVATLPAQDPEYLRENQESMTKVKEILVRIGDLEPDEKTEVQKGLDAVNRYQQLFASAVSTMGQGRQEPVNRIRGR